MTFAIAHHAQTIAINTDGAIGVPSAPPAFEEGNGILTTRDFSLVDLGTGSEAAVVVHRVEGVLPARFVRLEYSLDEGLPVALPGPVGGGVHTISGLSEGVLSSVILRVVALDTVSGAEVAGPWSPAKTVLPTRFTAENLLSDTVDPIANTSGDWDGATVWSGALSSEGYAQFSSAEAAQDVPVSLLPAPGEGMLLIAEVERNGAAVSGLRASFGGVADVAGQIDWSDGSTAITVSSGVALRTLTRVSYNAVEGKARLALTFTLPSAAVSSARGAVTGAGTGFRGIDFRAWTFGDANWPVAEAWTGPAGARRLVAPTVAGFAGDTLQISAEDPLGVGFTVFGSEDAASSSISALTRTITGVSVAAGGSGYFDGTYVLAVTGGKGGRVSVTVSGGAAVSAFVVDPGREYTATPSVGLDVVAGGLGAVISVTASSTMRDFWPAVNDGRTRAAWDGRVLGQDGFTIEGFVAQGQYWPAGTEHVMPSGVGIQINADGSWTATGHGRTEATAFGDGELRSLGLVVGNGGRRSVLEMPLGFTGSGDRPLRLVMVPRLTGSARLGEALVALPGAIEQEAGFVPRLSYQWYADDLQIPGEEEARLRLVPGLVPVGAQVFCRVSWDGIGGAEFWDTGARTVGDFKVIDDGDAVTIGALTPAGVSGVPIGAAGTQVTGGDPSGHWSVVDQDGIAFLRPSSGPSTPGSDPVTTGQGVISGSYALTLTGARSLAVTVEAGAITCGRRADLAAVAQRIAAPAGEGVYGFDFGSGIRLVLWNSGDWGALEDIAIPETRIEDLELVGSDADGGAGAVVVAPYDPLEQTAIAGGVHLARARNVIWEVDLDHAPQGVIGARSGLFAEGALVVPGEIGRTLRFKDCRIQGAYLMAERLRGPMDPGGIVLGQGASQMSGSGAAAVVFEGVEIADIGAVTTTTLGTVTLEDCRVHRCGTRPLRLGADVGALTLRRTQMEDAVGASPYNPGAWIAFEPEGATGYAPTYRPAVPVTIEDCVILPGLSGLPAMGGVQLETDAALATGGEAEFGFVYSPLVVRRSIVVASTAEGLLLSSGETGEITDSAFLIDGRTLTTLIADVTHENSFRPLGSGFVVTRSIFGSDMLGGGVSRTDAVTLSAAGYGAAFEGDGPAGFAPRSAAALFASFTPVASGAADLGAAVSDTAGALDKAGAFKGDLSAVPVASPVDWGASSFGNEDLFGAPALGQIPSSEAAFGVLASVTSGIAPLSVTFRPTGISYFEQRTTTLDWDFEEDYTFETMPARSLTPRSSRYALGPLATHVFTTPGEHMVTLRQRTRTGVDRSAQVRITVDAQDTAYPGSATMVFSAAGNFADAPAGAGTTTSTATARAHVAQSNARLLLRAGEVTDLGNGLNVGAGSCLSRFGAGANPIIQNTIAYTPAASGYQIVEGVDVQSNWDPLVQDQAGILGVVIGGSSRKVMFRSVIQGVSNGIQSDASEGRGSNFTFADSRVQDFHGWGIIPSFCTNMAFVGSSVVLDFQEADVSGPVPNLFGPFRSAGFDGYVIQQTYIQYDKKDGFSQPTLRLSSSTADIPGNVEISITQCHTVGTGIGGSQPDQNLVSPGAEIRFLYFGHNKMEVGADFLGGVSLPYFSQTTIENNLVFGTAQRATTAQQSIIPVADPIAANLTANTVASSENVNNTGRPWICRNNTSNYSLLNAVTGLPDFGAALRRGHPIIPDGVAFDDVIIANNIEQMPVDDRTLYRSDFLQLCEEGAGLADDGRPRPGSLAVSYHLLDTTNQPLVDIDGVTRAEPPVAGAYATVSGPGFAGPADSSNAALVTVLSTGLTAGVLYLMDDWSTLRQNTDGTGAVTQAGDPVGWAQDLLGGQPAVAPSDTRRGVAIVTDGGRQAVHFPVDACLVTTADVGPIDPRDNLLFSFGMRFAQPDGFNVDPNALSLCCGMALGAATNILGNTIYYAPRGRGNFFLGRERIRRQTTPAAGVPRAVLSAFVQGNISDVRAHSLFEGEAQFTNKDVDPSDQVDISNRVFLGANFTSGDLTGSDMPTEFSSFMLVNNPSLTTTERDQVVEILKARMRTPTT